MGIAGTLTLGVGAVTGNVTLMVVGGVLIVADVAMTIYDAHKAGNKAAENWEKMKREQFGDEMFEELYGKKKNVPPDGSNCP